MKIYIVRHGEPDYSTDSLTETGIREAKYLSEKISQKKIKDFYCSPMGRAKQTARYTLQKMNREAEICDWLAEFSCDFYQEDGSVINDNCWDYLPQDWEVDPIYYDVNNWYNGDFFTNSNVKEHYQWVVSNFDKLLEKHGYKREGNYYRCFEPNEDEIVLFCHFGLGCVLLSHLMNCSPMSLWHHLCASTASISTIVSEERRESYVSFRMIKYSDTSFMSDDLKDKFDTARFCEMYKNEKQRHD